MSKSTYKFIIFNQNMPLRNLVFQQDADTWTLKKCLLSEENSVL